MSDPERSAKMKSAIHVILCLLTILAFTACSSTRITDDPFVFKKGVFRPMDKSKIKKIEIVLGKERLLHYSGVILLPERLAITSDEILASVIKTLGPEEQQKFEELSNQPVGMFDSYVDFFDADDSRIGTVFIYKTGARVYEFDKLIEEIKQQTFGKTEPNQRLQTMRFKIPMNAIAQGPHV